jgi:chorismate mutase
VTLGPLTRDRKAYLGRDVALVGELDAWLRARELDGTLAELRARWLGSDRGARPAAAVDLDALEAFLALRLAFMPAVAEAKERSGLPIENPAQEERVLASARAAAIAHGLAPDTVEALFRAQIVAARGIEKTVLAVPPARRPPIPTLDLDREARPALAAHSERIVAYAAQAAEDPEALARTDPQRVADALDGTQAPEADRLAIGRAVVALRRAR